jgi:ATP-binding cassette, subfamily B, bacterial PglK
MLIFVRMVGQTLRLLGSERRWRWALLVGLALAVTAFEAVGAMLVFTLLGLVGGGEEGMVLPVVGDITAWLPDASTRTLQLGVATAVAVFFLIRAGVVIGQHYLQARLVNNAGARLANHLVRGYLAMPYLEHTRRNSAELVRNAFDSVQHLVTQVMKPAVEVTAEVILVVGLTLLLLVVSPVAVLVALAVLGPAVWLLLKIVQPKLKRLGRESQVSRQGSLLAIQQGLGGFRDIRLLGREDEFARVFARHRGVMSRTQYMRAALSELPRALIETSLVLVIVIVFVTAILAGQGAEAMLSTLGVFAYAGLRLQPSLRKVVSGLNNMRFGQAVLDDLLTDRLHVDELLRVQRERRTHAGRAGLQRSIEVRGAAFSYAPEGQPALHDVDLTIRKGEFVGICGPTGGGKSTLIDLITGLLQPTEGAVLVDGEPLGPEPAWWHAHLGVVSQSVFLIDDTLRRNIAFGRPDEEIDEALLDRTVERAQLRDVVAGLPEGLDTVVGERGIRLSGGQRQRVAIARALYREPDVVIFDEGTSALDAATEAALVGALDELKAGRTLISVAHRISTVRNADRIVVVEGGRIAAQGTYDELLEHSELFRSLAR